jgi:hypothetical protein
MRKMSFFSEHLWYDQILLCLESKTPKIFLKIIASVQGQRMDNRGRNQGVHGIVMVEGSNPFSSYLRTHCGQKMMKQ